MTLALNVADPLIGGQFGKAAFDAVGPLLLIGWSEVGPSMLHALTVSAGPRVVPVASSGAGEIHMAAPSQEDHARPEPDADRPQTGVMGVAEHIETAGHFLDRAREEDSRHRLEYQRPISAETLRRRPRIGAPRSRELVAQVRLEAHRSSVPVEPSVVGSS